MLELFERGYVIEHCVSTFNAMQKEEWSRAYSCELLRGIAKRIGFDVPFSYFDMLEMMKPKSEENEADASVIIESIRSKANAIAES